MKGLPWDSQDGIVRGRPRKEPAPPPPILFGENAQNDNPDVPDKTEATHSEMPKETVPMSDDRNASHIKSKSSVYTTDEVRQRLKFDGEASGMTPDPKRSKDT